MLSALFGGGGGGRRSNNNNNNSNSINYNEERNNSSSIFGLFKKRESSTSSSSLSPSKSTSPGNSKTRDRDRRKEPEAAAPPFSGSNSKGPVSSVLRSLQVLNAPSPPPAAPNTLKKSHKSSKSSKHRNKSSTTLESSSPSRKQNGGGVGGYGYTRSHSPSAFPYSDERHSFSRQALPSLLSNHPLFPKPTGFLYNIRSALSSSHSLSHSLVSPSPKPSERSMSKTHNRSSKDRDSKSSRNSTDINKEGRRSSTGHRMLTAIGEEPRDEVSVTRKDSSRSKKEHSSTKSKSKSSRHHDDKERDRDREHKEHRHRSSDDKKKKKRKKEKDAESSKIPPEPLNASPPPPPPPPITIDLRHDNMPIRPPSTSSRLDQANLLQAVSIALSSDQVRKEILTHATMDSENFRVTLEQIDDGIKLRTIPSKISGPGLSDDDNSDPDSDGLATPKGIGSPKLNPVVKVVNDDETTVVQDGGIDFLLPFGGLEEPFDSGYEIENDASEGYEMSDSTSLTEDQKREIKAAAVMGKRPTSMYSKASFSTAFTASDPLTQQLPVLLSLVDNTVGAYETILDTKGSFAVGISGYRSVARRLLDRVDTLFTRKLGDDCASWGELLEVIGGHRKLPPLTSFDPTDEDDLMELLGDNDEKREIYNTCLEVPEILNPALRGLTRLYPKSQIKITREVTALFLTTFPQYRPILQAASEVTSDEMDLLKSKRFAAFLEIDGIKKDEEKELRECEKIEAGVDRALNELDIIAKRLRTIKSGVQARKTVMRKKHRESIATGFTENKRMSMEVREALEEIQLQRDVSQVEETLGSSRLSTSHDMPDLDEIEDFDDAGSVVPDDSASQIFVRQYRDKEAKKAGKYKPRKKPYFPDPDFIDGVPETPEQERPRSSSHSVYSQRTLNTSLTSLRKKKKHALVRVALQDGMYDSTPRRSVSSPMPRTVTPNGSTNPSTLRSATLTPSPDHSSRTSDESRGTKSTRKKDLDRPSTPLSNRRKGVGGYGSSTPVTATTRTGTIVLMKEKDSDSDGSRGKAREKKSKR